MLRNFLERKASYLIKGKWENMNGRIIRKIKAVALGCLFVLAACGKAAENNEVQKQQTTITNTSAPTIAPTLAIESTPVPDNGDIELNKENFPDINFRMYLEKFVDLNQDKVLCLAERETVIRIQNDYADYDKSAWWNECHVDTAWWDEPDKAERCKYIDRICNLEGIEYFPNLYEIQIRHIDLVPEITELVITNPNLEIFKLSFGREITIDLTACKKLRTCIINFDSEIESEILLPEHLEVTPLNGYECVIGETARKWMLRDFTEPSPTPVPQEDLPCTDYAIDWKDENLKAAMQKETEIRDREIMLSDVYGITELNLRGNDISDISALSVMENLVSLNLGDNDISDISVLEKLTKLQGLNLDNNEIEDISPLSGLYHLVSFSAEENRIVDISPLSGLSNLNSISMRNNQIEDITALSGLQKLEHLWLENNRIIQVDSLTNLPALRVLLLENNRIEEIHWSDMPMLWALGLEQNAIREISLKNMPELAMIDLDDNFITEVSGLAELEGLVSLDLRGTLVEDIEPVAHVLEIYYNGGIVRKPLGETAITPSVTVTPLPTSTPTPAETPTPTPIPVSKEDISLEEAYFPDEMFREFLAVYVDYNKDGILTWEERTWLTAIDCSGPCLENMGDFSSEERQEMYRKIKSVVSFEGLEYFDKIQSVLLDEECAVECLPINHPNLEILNVQSNSLKEFSLQNAPELIFLLLRSNPETAKNIEIQWDSLSNLQEISLRNVPVSMEDCLKREHLLFLTLENCDITWNNTSVDFSLLPQLVNVYIKVSGPQEAEILDFSKNNSLEGIRVTKGAFAEIKLSNEDVILKYYEE